MTCWMRWLIAICMCATLSLPDATTGVADETKRVMILHSFGRDFRPWSDYARTIRLELDRQSPWTLNIQDQSLITGRSEDDNPEAAFVQYLNALGAKRAPDLIICLGAPAANFVQRHRNDLFPATPMLLTSVEQRRIRTESLTENDVVVPVAHDFPAIFRNILRVLPDTKTIVVINGASTNEKFWLGELQRDAKPFENRVKFLWFENTPFQTIAKEAAALPPNSAIFWHLMSVDAAGFAHEGDSALRTLFTVANAPIFAYDDSYIGSEIVGGPMFSVVEGSQLAAAVAIRILAGEKPGEIKVPPLLYAAPKYDWRQLQRWGISESLLPPGSEVLFREPSSWEKYRWQIALTGALILFQGGMISVLLHERRRRQFAEIQSRRSMSELSRANRFATAGELTASIAHEINQPLGAIQINADSLDLMLKSLSPDISEIKKVVADIRCDQERASEVIRRMRSLLKKAPFEVKEIDLSETVREAKTLVSSLSALAVARQVDLSISLSPEPLPVRGDRIQLQQVVLNLIVNAVDAMADMPSAQRKVTVRTARIPDFAEVTISDAGPGIPPEKLKEVFEPFFTTKAQGMGMGLSIVRTIVEAHNGQIIAENQAGGGAIFRVKLPLAKTEGIRDQQAADG